jgi:secreted trypsin-like serine protease
MKTFIAVLFLAAMASADADIESRITSGTNARAGLIKCYVTIVVGFDSIGDKVCGACLLAGEQSLITSAGCVFSASDGKANNIKFFTTLAGPNAGGTNDDRAFVYADAFKLNGYDPAKNTSLNDVAVIFLKDRIRQTGNLQGQGYIQFEEKPDAFVGEELVVCGHGFVDNYRKKPTTLQCTTLRVVPAAECGALIAPPAPAPTSGRRKRQAPAPAGPPPPKGVICTKNIDDKNVCGGGDQGAPVFSNKSGALALVGVVSFYPDARQNARCKDGHYAIVSQLGSFRDFINDPKKPQPPPPAAAPSS